MRRPNINRGTTSRDLANVGIGYSASGASQYSRKAASMPVRKVKAKRSTAELILEQQTLLEKLCWDMMHEDDLARLGKMEKNFEIKTRFIETLRKQAQ